MFRVLITFLKNMSRKFLGYKTINYNKIVDEALHGKMPILTNFLIKGECLEVAVEDRMVLFRSYE